MFSLKFESEEKAAKSVKYMYWGIFEDFLGSGDLNQYLDDCTELDNIISKSGLLDEIFEIQNKMAFAHILEVFEHIFEVLSKDDQFKKFDIYDLWLETFGNMLKEFKARMVV